MKVKWRQHEFILVTTLAIIALVKFFIRLLTKGHLSGETLKLYGHTILLQVLIITIAYVCYVWLNKVVIAKLRTPRHKWLPTVNAVFKGEPVMAISVLRIVAKYSWLALQFAVIIYLLGPVTNFATYYYTNGARVKSTANDVSTIFPLHPQPFFNTFGGFDITLFFVGIYLLYAALREAAIYAIAKPAGRQQLRILIANQVTLFTLVFTPLLPGYFNPSFFFLYFTILPATLTVFMVCMYWLFPQKGDVPLLKSPIVGRLLLLTAVCALPMVLLPRAQMVGPAWFFIAGWAFNLLVIAPVAWFAYNQKKDKILQLRGMEAALTRSKADVQFLRSQINPHFLFNVLNTLYGTALQERSERTAEGIQKLGDMMRFMLHDNNRDFIPMSREIDYLRNYIALQKLRIQSTPNIVINDGINSDGCNNPIAPMLLIPFVENAFKHGISLREASWINVSLSCTAGQINFEVRNSMHPRQDNDTEQDKSGIGIINVKERLNITYPGKHRLVYNGDGREFFVQLTITI